MIQLLKFQINTNGIAQRTQKFSHPDPRSQRPTLQHPRSDQIQRLQDSRLAQQRKKGIALPLGKRQVPEIVREVKWQGALATNQGIFPILQHGLRKLCLRIRGQRQGRSEARSAGPEARHRQARPREATSDDHHLTLQMIIHAQCRPFIHTKKSSKPSCPHQGHFSDTWRAVSGKGYGFYLSKSKYYLEYTQHMRKKLPSISTFFLKLESFFALQNMMFLSQTASTCPLFLCIIRITPKIIFCYEFSSSFVRKAVSFKGRNSQYQNSNNRGFKGNHGSGQRIRDINKVAPYKIAKMRSDTKKQFHFDPTVSSGEGGGRIFSIWAKKFEAAVLSQGSHLQYQQHIQIRNLGHMQKKSILNLEQRTSTSNKFSPSEMQPITLHSHISPIISSLSPPQNPAITPSLPHTFSGKPGNGNSMEEGGRHSNGGSVAMQLKKIQGKKDVFYDKIQEKDESHSRSRQRRKQTQADSHPDKCLSQHSHDNEIHNYDQFMLSEKQLQRNKRHQKMNKKREKGRINYSELYQNSNQQIFKTSAKNQENLSPQLLQYFNCKYPYYLLGKTILFPIEDSLFITFPELKQSNSGRFNAAHKNHYDEEKLPANFSSELQIWNIVKEHPAFFELRHEISLEDVTLILKNQKTSIFRQLFKDMHLFYIKDITNHKYDESSTEQHNSFISLWKYADQNNILDKIFVTCWNKLIELYININKNTYTDVKIKEANEVYASMLRATLQKGKFNPPENYSQLLSYFLFLINMCFETHTFRNLINDKMLFFRDNNKMKNELLQQKKDIQSLLWDIKEQEKKIAKKEKTLVKSYKKEQKGTAMDEQNMKYNNTLAQIENQKNEISQKRQAYLNEITNIQNNIYQLSCLPQFSNVWFLGEDRYRNLYWFIKGSQNSIYKETPEGKWSKISNKNIDLFQNTLNLRGIREKKLHEKISYYKQLGYLKIIGQGEQNRRQKNQASQLLKNDLLNSTIYDEQVTEFRHMTTHQIQNFSYLGYRTITPAVIKILILKSELMMTKYLFERNSKWTTEENRQAYIKRINEANLDDLDAVTQDLRTFNEKICVVEISIKTSNGDKGSSGASDASKTRKIQTKIWGINEKYKHFWYDYSRKCKNISDLYFLVSVLYLTIEKYVTKTRKPNNTKYFYKTVQFGEVGELNETCCGYCQNIGELQVCGQCEAYLHLECLTKHESMDCHRRKKKN